jgi:hypothetical protein
MIGETSTAVFGTDQESVTAELAAGPARVRVRLWLVGSVPFVRVSTPEGLSIYSGPVHDWPNYREER